MSSRLANMSNGKTTLFPGVALVIGAASGIGRAVALSFAAEGCRKIAMGDTDLAGLKDTTEMLEKYGLMDMSYFQCDVSDEEQIRNFVSRVVRIHGRIDYAVNAAGIMGRSAPSVATSRDEFDKINNVNYRGCWLCSKYEIQAMLRQEPLPTHDGRPGNRGSVVNIASQLAISARPAAPAYCASKAAVVGMTKADAIDYAPQNIRVNCICPGVIDTPMTTGTPEQIELLKPAISIAPVNRMGTAQEVADAVLFLSSSKATFMIGAALVVDGGYTIN